MFGSDWTGVWSLRNCASSGQVGKGLWLKTLVLGFVYLNPGAGYSGKGK